MRDDFTKRTITEIAKGVGYRCSNPECRRPTVGANAAQDGAIIIGVAAHICAASPGGPRYNAAQTPEARRSKENGLWLCQNCGRLIDADPDKFTTEKLTKWKRDAQTLAFRELVVPSAALAEELARVEATIAADDRPIDAEFDALFQRIHAAAAADLGTYKRGPLWSAGTVELTLRIEGDTKAPPFNISRLPLAVEIAPEVTIVAPPGTGKTTTLLQLAGHALDAESIVPLYFRLGDWSAGSTGLLASLHQRSAFKAISADEISKIAKRGRLLLLLDGWNELAPDAHQRLRVEIGQIRRDWPDARIIVTTRRQALDVPISGPRVDIEPLSEDQQIAIADTLYGAAGKKIVDNAWRTPGVRSLIATPLYLSALLSGGSQGVVGETKEAVLRLFVEQHERAADHAEALQSALLGCHTEILSELASRLNAAGSTTMSETDARRIVATTIATLREQGQISASLEPTAVLETLTSHHTLMRSGGGVAFQHQQFQEWYASNKVADLMRASERGDAGAQVQLRGKVLNRPAWEEFILFAAERLSREEGSAKIVAHAVGLAVPIDPMLAAEMIYRAAPEVWELVKADIAAFVARWHKPGTVDRAVRFMIMTGRPEFAQQIWPLASSPDKQILIPTLRMAPRFRPGVLGPDLEAKVAELPEEGREHLLRLIAAESGVDGMDLAVELAKADPSPKVQAEVVQSLQFRRADRHVTDLLAAAYEEHFERIACKRFFALARQSQTYASPVRLEWLSNQVPTRFKRLNGLCCGAAGCRLKFREGRRGPRERVGTREEAERHPLGRTEFAVITLSSYEPSHLQQELCRFACRHDCLFEIIALPQRPYLPLGTLRNALSYPSPPDAFLDADDEKDWHVEERSYGSFYRSMSGKAMTRSGLHSNMRAFRFDAAAGPYLCHCAGQMKHSTSGRPAAQSRANLSTPAAPPCISAVIPSSA